MKTFSLIIAGLCLISCSPKKSKTTASSEPLAFVSPPTPIQNGSLIGSWFSCQVYPQGEIIGIKSSSIVYNFKDEKTMAMSADYFADEDCKTKFTQQMAEDYFKQYEDINKAPAPQDVKQSVLDLAIGIHQELPYLATKVPAGEIGTIDFLSLERPSYSSYKIWDDRIQIANVCQDLIEEGCEPIGNKLDNRATDVLEGDILIRK